MKRSAFRGRVLDWESFHAKMQPQFDKDGPIFPSRFIDLLPCDAPNLGFSLDLTVERVHDYQFLLCFLGYYPGFRSKTISRIQQWREGHPDRHFFVVIFNMVPRSWSAFTSSKLKVEADFAKQAIDAPFVVVKYNEQEDPRVSDSDFQTLHEKLEFYIAQRFADQIRMWIDAEDHLANGLSDTYSLYGLLTKLGFHSAAMKCLWNLLMADLPFWPPVPTFYEIVGEYSDDLSSSLSILCAAMSDFFRSAVASGVYEPLYEFVTRSFAALLTHSKLDEEVCYSRHFIQKIAATFADRLEDQDPDRSAEFSLIAFEQLSQLLRLKVDWNQPFLANIPPERRDLGFLETAFVLEWSRLKAVRGGLPTHRLYFVTAFFRLLCLKGDRIGAENVLSDHGIDIASKSCLHSLFVADVIGYIFEWHPTKETAQLVIESRLPDDMKLRALTLLKKVRPRISIRPVFRSPSMLTTVPLFSSAKFTLTFSVPEFLMSQTVIVFLKFKSDEETITSIPVTLTLSSRETSFSSKLVCNYSGRYESVIFCMRVENSELRWTVPVTTPITIDVYQNLPRIEMRAPWLVSSCADRQAAIFTINNIDTTCREIGLTWTSEGLLGVEFQGRAHDANEELVLRAIPSAMEVLLHLDFRRDDQITAVYRYVLKDTREGDFVQTFVFPTEKPFGVTLYAQNSRFQQWQLVNPFPTTFTFEFRARKHALRPMATYFLLRPTCPGGISIVVAEDGWERFPVTCDCGVDAHRDILEVRMNVEKWRVGESRVAVLGEGAAVINDPKGDWIVAELDSRQTVYLMIPRHRGRIRLPRFIVRRQVVQCSIEWVEILPVMAPQYILL
jgi:hypothetical protein